MTRVCFTTSIYAKVILLIGIGLSCIDTNAVGQRNRKSATAHALTQEARALVDTTFENGLRFLVWMQPDAESAAANFHWDYKPPLQGMHAGLDELTALCLLEMLKESEKDHSVEFKTNPSATSELRLMAADSSLFPALMQALELWQNPNWNESSLQVAREFQFEAWNDRIQSNPAAVASLLQHRIYTSGHPLGEIQSNFTLDSASLDLVQTHFHRYYQPNICTLTMVIRDQQDESIQALSLALENWKTHEVQNSTVIVPGKPNRNEISFIQDPDAKANALALGHLIRIQPNHADAVCGKLLAFWTMNQINQAERFPSPSAVVFAPHELNGMWMVSSDSVPDSLMNTWVETVKKTMQLALDSVFSDQALAALKNEYLDETLKLCQHPMPWNWLDEGRADRWLLCNPEELEKTLQRITPRDVLRVANAHLRPLNLHISIVGNEEAILNEFSSYESEQAVNEFSRQIQWMNRYNPAPAGWTAQTVFTDFYEACGGESKFKTLRSCQKKGTMSGQRGMKLDLEILEVSGVGHHAKFSLDGQVMMEHHVTQDGGYTTQMGRKMVLSQDEFLRMKKALHPDYLNHLEELEAEGHLLGSTNSNGKLQWVVELTRMGKPFQTLFFDSETHLLSRMIEERFGPSGPMKVITAYAGYTLVDGILFPMQFAQITRDEQIIITLEEIKPNARIDSSLFK